MKRREFITLLGGAAAAWPLVARAQPEMPVIGFVYAGATSRVPAAFVSAFRQGLKEGGFVEGQNVALEYHYSGGESGQLADLAGELVHRRVTVIVGNTPAAMAAIKATSTIPIVFATGADPVKLGLVASFNRPGGNATGVSFLSAALEAKRLELLHKLLPQGTVIAAFVDPSFVTSTDQVKDLQDAARAFGWQIHVIQVSNESELESGFDTLARQRPDAIIVSAVPLFDAQRSRIIELAARHSLPAMYPIREFPAAGGLMSYGDSISDAFRQAGVYTASILKGAKPGDLPVLRPTKFELVINAKAAKALGLTIPDDLLGLADEVIE
jgi:putative tryptophan/tyrosine transport system substrate-binding protein